MELIIENKNIRLIWTIDDSIISELLPEEIIWFICNWLKNANDNKKKEYNKIYKKILDSNNVEDLFK